MMAKADSSLSGPVKVNGDGRFDTPGHCATCGVYTMMDAETSKILVSNLVKVPYCITPCITLTVLYNTQMHGSILANICEKILGSWFITSCVIAVSEYLGF